LSGPYRIPNIEVSFASVYTHRVPVTPYRGAGQPQAVFVLERVMDLIARETRRDRAAVRFANFVQPADMPYDVALPNYRGFGNVIYDSGDYPAVLRRALEMSGWDRLTKECLRARQEGRLLGVGLACYVELTGVGPFEGATIRADSAGRITVFTGVPSQGQGLETTLAQVAADELGVTPDEGSIVGGDTLGIGQGMGTFASRAAVVGGSAVALAARELRSKAVRLAAHALGIGVASESGLLSDPTSVEGQLQGAVALGRGNALLEEARYGATGQPLATTYMECALPRSDDVPPVAIDHLETLSPLNPLGLKGVGES